MILKVDVLTTGHFELSTGTRRFSEREVFYTDKSLDLLQTYVEGKIKNRNNGGKTLGNISIVAVETLEGEIL